MRAARTLTRPALPATASRAPHADYSKMMEMTDAFGAKIFETIQITLVCDDCLKTDAPEKCAGRAHTKAGHVPHHTLC